jgi:hypothetical protein
MIAEPYPKTLDNVKSGLKLAALHLGFGDAPDFGTTAWERFGESLGLRQRVTHPKRSKLTP